MEKCIKYFLLNEEPTNKEIMFLFGWKETKRFAYKHYVKVCFERENRNYKLDFLEKKYKPRFVLPLWLLILIAVIIITLVTVYVIRFATKTESYDKMLEFACFMLPALILILCDAGIFMGRYLSIMKNIESNNSLSYIKNEVEKITNG